MTAADALAETRTSDVRAVAAVRTGGRWLASELAGTGTGDLHWAGRGRTCRGVRPGTFSYDLHAVRLDPIRKAFAKANGVKPALFSANSEGACPACNGNGVIYTDLAMMAGVTSPCELCEGRRFQASVLEYTFGGRDIAQVLAAGWEQLGLEVEIEQLAADDSRPQVRLVKAVDGDSGHPGDFHEGVARQVRTAAVISGYL